MLRSDFALIIVNRRSDILWRKCGLKDIPEVVRAPLPSRYTCRQHLSSAGFETFAHYHYINGCILLESILVFENVVPSDCGLSTPGHSLYGGVGDFKPKRGRWCPSIKVKLGRDEAARQARRTRLQDTRRRLSRSNP